MVETIEETIIVYLLFSDKYFSKIIPFIQPQIFLNENLKEFVKVYIKYSNREKRLKLADVIEKIKNDISLNEAQKKRIKEALKIIKEKLKEVKELKELGQELSIDELVDETEKYFKTRLIENAILEAAQNLQEGKSINLKRIEEALGFAFNTDLGVVYSDIEKRLQYYSDDEKFYPTNIVNLDKLLGGGFVKKSLYVFTGKTNIGKSLLLCAIATLLLKQGFNVLYLSGELTEKMILERIDSNVCNISIRELRTKTKDELRKIFENSKVPGELIIKDFPTGSVSTAQIKSYINDLKLKLNFKPDFIIVDYITLFLSGRLPKSASRDMYNYYKSVAEEFRAIASELDSCVITATQLNREGAKLKKVTSLDTTFISESFGVAFTADFQAILFQNDALRRQGLILMKCVKTRFDSNVGEIYEFKIDYDKMRIEDPSDLSKEEQEEVTRARVMLESSIDEKPGLEVEFEDFEEV